ncbi:MAG TPA: polysaccharide deacetylase family protein [Gemmatimonadota bacterium]|jgi:peptidoglycan/xylan/chitin deacetylase (PgdA/CDA1 family)
MSLHALPPRILGWLDRSFLCEVPTAARRLALTFDDGPDPSRTPRVLELLARGGHTATFFCIGRNAERHPTIVAEAAAAGHEIANHTYSHPLLPLVSRRRLLEEVRRTEWILTGLAGARPTHFRPPMGWATPAILRRVAEEGYRAVLGTIYPADPRAPDAETIIERTVARLAPGRILILHDGSSRGRPRERTLEALPVILTQMEARGLRGVSVRELIGPAAVTAGPVRDRPPAVAPGSR